jgi:hypothetical protein
MISMYIFNVLVNDEQDLSLVKNSKELSFSTRLEELGKEYKITYDITNASKLFDASITITCTQSNNILSVTNDFDTSTNLLARNTRTGTLTLKKTQTNASETDTLYNISCNIVATPISRSTESTGEIIGPIVNPYSLGKELKIGSETYNVINSDSENVMMLAQKNINTAGRQSTTLVGLTFSSSTGWEHSPGPKEIDTQLYNGNVKNYLEVYKDNIIRQTGDENVSVDLITLKQLKSLGCTINDQYNYSSGYTCANSENSSWLVNGQSWWTRSAVPGESTYIWTVSSSGTLLNFPNTGSNGIRPVLTINKETLEKNTINFTINNIQYGAEEGMTWEEWLDSSYNVDNYISSESKIYDMYMEYIVLNSDYTNTHTTDLITNNYSYLLEVFCCFDAGSKVLMADGTLKNIEEVEIGDLVMSLNEDTGEYVAQRVSSTIINKKSTDLVYVYLSNGTRIGMRAYHPLLTTEGWKSLRPDSPDAKRENIEGLSLLEVGDTLVGYDENVTIVKVEQRPEVEDYYTYNLAIEGHHNYVVEGIVAHNGNQCYIPV